MSDENSHWGNRTEQYFINKLGYHNKPMVASRLKLLWGYRDAVMRRVIFNEGMDRTAVLSMIDKALAKEIAL